MSKRKTAVNVPQKATQLDYQAVQDKGRRQAPQSRTKHEDITLPAQKRRKLVATTRDQQRNYALLGWMLRRHLDYVSKFSPLVKTGDDALDEWLEKELNRHGKKRNFDVAKRHSRNSMMRLFEALKVLDGDCALLKVDGFKLQGIEGDRIAKADDLPKELSDSVTDHGLVLDMYGATSAYCLCRRDNVGGSMLMYDRIQPAEDVIFDGYFGRYDQTRGISPLSPVVNTSTDLHEAQEFTQLKIKLHSLMGVQINRELAAGVSDGFPTTAASGVDTDTAGDTTTENTYSFSPTGITIFDLDPGESVSTVESNTPSTEYLDWTTTTIRQILLALDIPYSAYDGANANFSSRIADREEYEKAAQEKRDRNKEVLEEIYEWVIPGWYATRPEFRRLVDAAGLAPEDVAESVQWTAAGTPWLDKLKEVNGDAAAIYNGIESRQRICKRRGTDFFDVIDEQAEELEYARSKGVQLAMGAPGQQTIEQAEKEVMP